MMTASNIQYEIAERTRATAHGGIGAVHLLVRSLELDQAIDRHLGLLKIHLPYHDSDHVLNIAYNLLAGGTCLEHLELLRSDAMQNLYELAGGLPPNAWKTLVRRAKHELKTRPRRRPENVKQPVVEARAFEDIRLTEEHVAEFRYRPVQCKHDYRIVVVWKDLEVYRGQKRLFDDARCFFYITNDGEKPAEEIVFEANGRCNQENLLAQLKGDVRSLTAPVDNLLSNWAYMAMGSLAWSLKAWAALMLPAEGRWQTRHREEKQKLLRMDFTTFRQAMMKVPAQILSTGRWIVYRLLAWNPWQHVFFRLLDQVRRPQRC